MARVYRAGFLPRVAQGKVVKGFIMLSEIHVHYLKPEFKHTLPI